MAASEDPSAIGARKAALRAEMRRRRGEIPPEERARLASAVGDRVLGLPALETARTVMVFASFGSEIPTEDLIRRLAAEGHTVLLPIVEGGGLQAARYRPGEPLVGTPYGPREPVDREAIDPARIDVAIIPGLAFDRAGGRLGYGGAFYDRYLPLLGSHALKVGIGFHPQLVEQVPTGPQDVRVDLLVSDREVVRCRAEASP